jgi:hypothetical protein
MPLKELSCWKCGSPMGDIPLPLARLAKCRNCNADLHCCRQCLFFDPSVSRQCREPIAEEVQNKQKANFCGYLQPDPDAWQGQDNGATAAARSRLDALFGLTTEGENDSARDTESARKKLDDLFK